MHFTVRDESYYWIVTCAPHQLRVSNVNRGEEEFSSSWSSFHFRNLKFMYLILYRQLDAPTINSDNENILIKFSFYQVFIS